MSALRLPPWALESTLCPLFTDGSLTHSKQPTPLVSRELVRGLPIAAVLEDSHGLPFVLGYVVCCLADRLLHTVLSSGFS